MLIKTINNGREVSLTVQSVDRSDSVCIPKVWAVDKLPPVANNIPSAEELDRSEHLKHLKISNIQSSCVMLLIRIDVPEVIIPLEVRRGNVGEPGALRSPCGWSVVGPLCSGNFGRGNVNFLQTGDDVLLCQLDAMWKTYFKDKVSDERPMSFEDKKALRRMEASFTIEDGHYKMHLTWRDSGKSLPNTKPMAVCRLDHLQRKLLKNNSLRKKFS